MFLTDDELTFLTGYKLPSAQIRWLRERGWRYEENRIGRPRVARAYCESRLGVKTLAEDPSNEPRWEMLSAKATKG